MQQALLGGVDPSTYDILGLNSEFGDVEKGNVGPPVDQEIDVALCVGLSTSYRSEDSELSSAVLVGKSEQLLPVRVEYLLET